MALQTSGAISLNDIHVEAGGSSGSSATINDTDIRGLISKGSGAASTFSEWYGASNYSYGSNAIWGSRWITSAGNRYNQQGGYDSLGSQLSELQYDDFNAGGTASLFGDMTADVYGASAVSNGSRIVFVGQQRTSPWSYVGSNRMKYVTVSSTGNATTFGTLAYGGTYGSSAMDTAGRAVNSPGETTNGNTYTSNLNYFQISTTGNASNFGTLPFGVKNQGATESTAGRLLWVGGGRYSSTNYNHLHYISSASVGGTGSDFGDLTTRRRYTSAATNGTRALIMGGAGHAVYSGSLTNRFNINYVTISTAGNASDFGNNTYARGDPAATSNGTRALVMGGIIRGGPGWSYYYTGSNIEYSTISTLSNASSFGNLLYYARNFDAASGS